MRSAMSIWIERCEESASDLPVCVLRVLCARASLILLGSKRNVMRESWNVGPTTTAMREVWRDKSIIEHSNSTEKKPNRENTCMPMPCIGNNMWHNKWCPCAIYATARSVCEKRQCKTCLRFTPLQDETKPGNRTHTRRSRGDASRD